MAQIFPRSPAQGKCSSLPATKSPIMLLYFGGLDTSVICRWRAERGERVICLAADVGQRENALRRKANKTVCAR